jgi:anaphase-promoting complex subunit 4
VFLEDALVDLESKMVHYDGESNLSVDLMELLMFGHAGIKLEKFLVNELTDKGLKRVGQVLRYFYTRKKSILMIIFLYAVCRTFLQ